MFFFQRLFTLLSSRFALCLSFSSGLNTADPREVAFYDQHAQEWWRPGGHFSPLLSFNQLRVPFIEKHLNKRDEQTDSQSSSDSPLKDVRVLDVGSGGGFLSETLAEKGARVVGIDVSEESVKVAQAHLNARLRTMSVDCDKFMWLQRLQYLLLDIEALRNRIYDRLSEPLNNCVSTDTTRASPSSLAQQHSRIGCPRDSSNVASSECTSTSDISNQLFDVVVASEVIEHVNNVETFFSNCADCIRPGGLLVITTPNRTPLSYLVVILLAEYVFRLLPKQTHFYSKFLTPRDISGMAKKHGLYHLETVGTFYIPFLDKWVIEPTKWITYMTAFRKKE